MSFIEDDDRDGDLHEPIQNEVNESADIDTADGEFESDATSREVVEAFLAQSGAAVTTGEGAQVAWYDEPLPEGHKSGFVAVIGRPNVGKSTLVNALVGQKVAIVSRKPQTTRTRVTGILTQPDYQLIFIDTPGMHAKTPYRLDKLMNEQAAAAIPDSDVVLFIVDAAVLPRDEDKMIARVLREKASKRPIIFVMNKMDRLSLDKAQAHIEAYWALLPGYADSIPTSALKGTNIELLRDHILTHIPEGTRYYPGNVITDQTEHTIAAELVREAMLELTYEEVPHSAAVLVEDYQERDNGMTYVSATIWVDRPSHKPIVIGREGARLKRIGSAARMELERFIGGRVYLELWVQVKPGWRDDGARLHELGIQ